MILDNCFIQITHIVNNDSCAESLCKNATSITHPKILNLASKLSNWSNVTRE